MKVLSLFDFTSLMVIPWAEAGHECHCVDTLHIDPLARIDSSRKGTIFKYDFDLEQDCMIETIIRHLEPDIVFSFPPCTHLSSIGTRHWKAKSKKDLFFQIKAAEAPKEIERVCNDLKIPFFVENPAGALASIWRPSDHSFDPCEFGGYLDDNDNHPIWPDYIPRRDAYTKRTYLWTGNGFVFHELKPVEPILLSTAQGNVAPQFEKLGGKSLMTKTIRSATPRGFAKAVFLANERTLKDESSS